MRLNLNVLFGLAVVLFAISSAYQDIVLNRDVASIRAVNRAATFDIAGIQGELAIHRQTWHHQNIFNQRVVKELSKVSQALTAISSALQQE